MTKNTNLALTVNKVYYTYPDVPVEVNNYTDRFHKEIKYDNTKTLWTEIQCTPGSASWEEKENTIDAGTIFEQKLKFILPGEDDTNTDFFDKVRRPILVKITFDKGLPKLVGCDDNPAVFERVMKTSAKESGSECLFTCKATEPAWWISKETVYTPN
jgi:hypothetical protein